MKETMVRVAPTVVAFSLIAGNVGLLVKNGIHPNMETVVGVIWIASDYALKMKARYPVAAPRVNASGAVLGSLLLAATGIHAGWIDWPRVRSPLGYIPAAMVVGFQRELRLGGEWLSAKKNWPARLVGRLTQYPYTVAAVMNSYGVIELGKSAVHLNDMGLLAICGCYGLATSLLPFFDMGRNT